MDRAASTLALSLVYAIASKMEKPSAFAGGRKLHLGPELFRRANLTAHPPQVEDGAQTSIARKGC
jgi:hypothetical protein